MNRSIDFSLSWLPAFRLFMLLLAPSLLFIFFFLQINYVSKTSSLRERMYVYLYVPKHVHVL